MLNKYNCSRSVAIPLPPIIIVFTCLVMKDLLLQSDSERYHHRQHLTISLQAETTVLMDIPLSRNVRGAPRWTDVNAAGKYRTTLCSTPAAGLKLTLYDRIREKQLNSAEASE